MRTRRSPRNQERLWKALGGPAPIKHDSSSIESLERQLANCIGARTRRMIERELQRARMIRAKG